jgi:hypothetical protein
MKHIKKFNENIYNREPKVGDYVIIKNDYFGDIEYDTFFNREIGQIIDIEDVNIDYLPYNVKFQNKTPDGTYICDIRLEEILAFSKEKEDLEVFINMKKYNI